MSRFATDKGVALLAALVVMALVAAMGTGLALMSSLEPPAAAHFEARRAARLAAEAGVAVAAHELADLADWSNALSGVVPSGILDHGPLEVDLPDGTRAGLDELTARATCGRPGPCSQADRSATTAARPWGANNPAWRLFGHARLDRLVPGGEGLPPAVIVVWVGDDPAEVDGNPLADSGVGPAGVRRPGGCVVALRAEAFGPRFSHATVLATVTRREPGPACGQGVRLVSLRALN
jgi:hypothetical protein